MGPTFNSSRSTAGHFVSFTSLALVWACCAAAREMLLAFWAWLADSSWFGALKRPRKCPWMGYISARSNAVCVALDLFVICLGSWYPPVWHDCYVRWQCAPVQFSRVHRYTFARDAGLWVQREPFRTPVRTKLRLPHLCSLQNLCMPNFCRINRANGAGRLAVTSTRFGRRPSIDPGRLMYRSCWIPRLLARDGVVLSDVLVVFTCMLAYLSGHNLLKLSV